MKSQYSQEVFVAIIFVIVLFLLLNPLGFFMPENLVYIMLAGFAVLFGLYLSFVVREKPQDEREGLHRFIANRKAYLWGSATLVIGIVYEGLTTSHINEWLLIVLGVMVIAKVSSLLYSDKHR